MGIPIEEGTKLVNSAVLGEEIHSVSVAGWWVIGFSNGIWLLAQNVVCSGEERINALLARAEPEVLSREDVTKALLIVSYRRRPVTECRIAKDGTLTLVFDQSRVLEIPTHADIVDWQWSLSPTGTGEPLFPYRPSDPRRQLSPASGRENSKDPAGNSTNPTRDSKHPRILSLIWPPTSMPPG